MIIVRWFLISLILLLLAQFLDTFIKNIIFIAKFYDFRAFSALELVVSLIGQTLHSAIYPIIAFYVANDTWQWEGRNVLSMFPESYRWMTVLGLLVCAYSVLLGYTSIVFVFQSVSQNKAIVNSFGAISGALEVLVLGTLIIYISHKLAANKRLAAACDHKP